MLVGTTSSPVQIATSGPHLAFIMQPSPEVLEGQSFGTVQVAIEDPAGNIISSDQSSVTLDLSHYRLEPANAAAAKITHSNSITPDGYYNGLPYDLLGTVTVSAQNGIATFTNIFVDDFGTYVLVAGDGTFSAAFSDPLTVDPSGKVLVFSANPRIATRGGS